MTQVFTKRYPRVMRYKATGVSYPNVVVALLEPGRGLVLYIPIPVTGNNASLTLFDTISVAESELISMGVNVVRIYGEDDPTFGPA